MRKLEKKRAKRPAHADPAAAALRARELTEAAAAARDAAPDADLWADDASADAEDWTFGAARADGSAPSPAARALVLDDIDDVSLRESDTSACLTVRGPSLLPRRASSAIGTASAARYPQNNSERSGPAPRRASSEVGTTLALL